MPPETSPRRRSRLPFLLCLVLLGVVCAVVLLFKVPEWRNDAALAGLEERVSAHPLPPDTERGDHGVQGTVGLQSGNSNHCDYLVRMSLRTKLSGPEITRYYESAAIEGVAGRALAGTVHVGVSGSGQDGYTAVIVEFFDGFHEPGMDLRCY